jgi:hypothetical protein
MLRLSQVAWVLGVNEKTADNAIRALGLPRPLDLDTACTLALAVRAKHRYGIPLKRGFPLARQAMIRPASRQNDPLIRDLRSYLRDVKARTRSPVMAAYLRDARGRPRKDRPRLGLPARLRRHVAIRRAIDWGLDLTLNDFELQQPVRQRLESLSENLRALHLLQGRRGVVSLQLMWETMSHAGVRFVVIGGIAGNAHGSARITKDLDVCYDTAPDNTDRLVTLLNQWHARLHLPKEPDVNLPFVIDARTFRDSPVLTLVTDHGRLDLLPEVAGVGDYAACLAASEVHQMGKIELRVLSLDALIRAKRAAGRKPDLEHLIELEALRALTAARPKGRPGAS